MIEEQIALDEGTRGFMQVMDKVTGFYVSKALFAAAKLGVADVMKDEPKTAAEIADKVGAHPETLYRTLRFLVSEGIFDQLEDGKFTLGQLGYYLRTDVPDSACWWAIQQGNETFKAWEHFLDTVKTGEAVFEPNFGMSFFSYLQQNPEAMHVFGKAMGSEGPRDQHVSEAYDYSQFQTLVDVGGGYGTQLQTILKNNANLKGIIYDLPDVIAKLKERLGQTGLEGRFDGVAGSFFEEVPAIGDAYMLSLVIHDWGDDKASIILNNCYKAMQPGNKLILAEQVLSSDKNPSLGKRLDLNMLVMSGGRERTKEEYTALLAKSGFELTNVYPTKGRLSILEAVRK